MNPRSAWQFLTSKFGLFLVFLAVLFVGLWIFGRQQAAAHESSRVAQSTKSPEVGQVRLPLEKGLEDGLPQQVEPPTAQTGASTDGQLVPFKPGTYVAPPLPAPAPPATRIVETEDEPPPAPKRVMHRAMLTSFAPAASTRTADVRERPERFMPFGTLLKCKLVNTVDSANIETPVIAVLLEDIWQNEKLVVPANTLVHGTARAGRIRDRINASGTWRFVWQDGRELAFDGVALDREYAQEIDGYGITDGSAGLKGRILAADNFQELKLLASAALSGCARGTQDRTQTALGTTITGSVSNGVREGTAEVFEMYAQRTLRDLEENGYFVRVPAGKEFYVYVLHSIDPSRATVAGAADSTTNLPALALAKTRD